MEMNKIELVKLEQALSETVPPHFSEMSDVQLALVGGGIGEVIVA